MAGSPPTIELPDAAPCQPLSVAAGSPLVAVLCVSAKSIYKQLAGVECYDMRRDVRSFAGGMPVVAHPPCRSWSAKCAHQAKPLPGEKDLGPLCVEWLRKCGGVLEHPANSRLFAHCGLPRPGEAHDGLWSIAVSQAWWGHSITKHTWLCFAHISPRAVEFPMVLHNGARDHRLWQLMSRAKRSATPRAMAEWLVATAALANI